MKFITAAVQSLNFSAQKQKKMKVKKRMVGGGNCGKKGEFSEEFLCSMFGRTLCCVVRENGSGRYLANLIARPNIILSVKLEGSCNFRTMAALYLKH